MTGSGDFLQLAALFESLRALGSSRVLDDVLAVVIDSAIEVSGAERGFIMLAGADGILDSRWAGRAAASRFQAARSKPPARFPMKCSRPERRGS